MKKLEWSDFEWFKKKSKVFINDAYFKCSEKIGLDQKLIFPIKNSKYLTFSTSKRYMDLHLSSEDPSIPKKPIFEIRHNKTKNIIKKQMRLKQLCKFIPNSNKSFKNWILVDPYSAKFLSQIHTMNGLNMLPHKLLKLRINNRTKHPDLFFTYDPFGQCLGIVKCNHRKNGFYFIPIKILNEIQGDLVNMEQVKHILHNEGFDINKKIQNMWINWNKVLYFFRRFHIARIITPVFYKSLNSKSLSS